VEEEEIELMDIINVLWKRKWLVTIGTLICMFIVGVISFLLKPVYEISTLIQPGKMLTQDEYGRYEEVAIEKPSQVAKRISEKTYDNIIAFELKIPLKELPEIEAEEVKDTYLVRAWVKNHDIQRGKEVLNSLIKNLRKDIDEKVDAELKMIDAQIANLENKIKSLELSIKDKENEIKLYELSIQSKEIERNRLNQDILSTKNKIKISEDRIKTLLDEMKVVKERMDRLEEEQRKALKEGTDDRSAISMLLYSNEIQNNLRYYNTLEDRLSSEKVNLENLNFQINSKEQDIRQLENDISEIRTKIVGLKNDIEKIKTEIETIKNQIYLLKEKKKRIDYTKVVKSPAPSLYPVFPKKKLNVLIAGILGGTLFSFLAFFLEYLEKRKEGNG
jgi:uncharacterized protein involved in exopolysaccharide biosynthesis